MAEPPISNPQAAERGRSATNGLALGGGLAAERVPTSTYALPSRWCSAPGHVAIDWGRGVAESASRRPSAPAPYPLTWPRPTASPVTTPRPGRRARRAMFSCLYDREDTGH